MPTLNDDELYQAYLTKVYQHTRGYQTYSAIDHEQFTKANVCITYGELLYPSVKKIIRTGSFAANDIVLDLGSGLGKYALQIFIQTDVKKVIGIEASQPLHQQALQSAQQLKADFPFYWDEQRELSLICDNFLHADWQGATMIYTCSTCFTSELLVAIGDKINAEPQVTQVMSLRPLPTLKLPLKKAFAVECSWDSALCFYYALGS